MTRATRIVRLATVVGFEAGALTFLLRLGRRPWMHVHWTDFGSWIRSTTAEDAIAAFIWRAALGCMVWLGGSTLLYLVARVSRMPVLIRSVGWLTLPAIRRATERAVGTVLVASSLAAVPVRADPPPPVVMMIDHDGSLRPPGLGAHAPEALEDPAGPVESTVPPSRASPMKHGLPTAWFRREQ